MATIIDVYEAFNQEYSYANKILSDSTFLYENRAQAQNYIYSVEIHHAIVEHCFMNVFLAWEVFLESSFIAYLRSENDLKGNTYVRYAFPLDYEHAYNMIKGTRQYPDWTNIYDINYLANLFFESSGPYILLRNNPVELGHIKTIRNKISHVSEKSTIAFNRLLAQMISSTDISVAEFLMQLKDEAETYYTYYTGILKSYVEAICNA